MVGVGDGPQHRRRAGRRHRTGECPRTGRLCGLRARWPEPGGSQEGGNGDGDRLGGHAGHVGEVALVTCCWRQAASSSTTLTSSGSAKSATGGSLKARCPFSPMPRQHRSSGWPQEAASGGFDLGVAQPLHVVRRPGWAARMRSRIQRWKPAGWSGPTPTYSSMWKTTVSDHGTSAVAWTSASTKASWELPVANIAWATPRAATAADDGGASSAAGRAIAVHAAWTRTVARFHFHGLDLHSAQHASPHSARLGRCATSTFPGRAHIEAAWAAVRRFFAVTPRGGVAPTGTRRSRSSSRPCSRPARSRSGEASPRCRRRTASSRAVPSWPRRPATTDWGSPTRRPTSAPGSPSSCRPAPRRPRFRPSSSSTCGLLRGEGYREAETHALELAEREGSRYVSPYNDADVIAGQATLARELLEQVPRLGTVVVPCGGGGLLAGMTLALDGTGVHVVGVESEASPSMSTALARRRSCRSMSSRPSRTAWPATSSPEQ